MQKHSMPVKLQLIGQVHLFVGTRDVTPRSRKAQALLGILALSSAGPVTRNQLAGLLWERAEPEQARALLRGAIHEIQKSVGEVAPDLLNATRDHLALRFNNVQIDMSEAVQHARVPDQAEPPLMESLEAIGPVFQAWLSAARLTFAERLKAARSELRDRGRDDTGEVSQVTVRHGLPNRTDIPKSPFVAPIVERRRSNGVRIGVAPIQCFGTSKNDPIAIVLADAIGAALAQFRWMSVLSSDMLASSFRPGPDIAMAQDRLNLNYIVEGKLFRDEAQIRFRLSLIDVHEQAILTTFKADRRLSDLVTFEDEVAAHVAASIDAHLQVVESRRAAAHADPGDAHGLLMQAIALVCRLDQFSLAKASSLLDQAVALDPQNVSVRIGRAQFHMVMASQGWAPNPGEALQKAEEETMIALILDPFEARAVSIAAHVRSLRHRQPDDAGEMHRQALQLNPGSPFALHFAAANDLIRGDLDGARASLERHRQLVAPTGQHLFVNSAISLMHLLGGDYEKVVQMSRAVLHLNPGFVAAYKPYLAALGHLGLSAEAKLVRARLATLDPSFSIKGLLAGSPFRRIQDSERYTGGLRRAGIS